MQPSVWFYLQQAVNNNPDGYAVIVEFQKANRLAKLLGTDMTDDSGNESLTCTFKQILRASLRLSAGLIKQGVQPGDTIAALIPSGIEWLILYWTNALMKTTLAMLDPGACLPARKKQLQSFMEITKPKVVLVDTEEHSTAVEEAIVDAVGVIRPTTGILLQGSAGASSSQDTWLPLAEVMEIGGRNPIDETALLEAALRDDLNRIAWIFFTSGTSVGAPKGVPRTVGSITHIGANNWRAPSDNEPLPPVSRWNITTANYRIAAATAMFGIYLGAGTIVLPSPVFEAGAVIRATDKWKVSWSMMFPSQLHEIIKHPDYSPDRVKSLIGASFGGDILMASSFELVQRTYPATFLRLIIYAMTEGSGWFAPPFILPLPIDQLPFLDGIAPSGRGPQRGVRIRVWNPETKAVLPRGETGELVVHSHSVIPHYLGNDEEVNKDAFFIDDAGLRWFRTGDSAIITESGLVYITGRLSSIFKRAAIPINPTALESSIISFLGADQLISVLPIPSTELGHEPFAVVTSLAGKTKKEIMDHILETFGDAYALADVVELKDLGFEKWPLNASGKIMKMDLLAAIAVKITG